DFFREELMKALILFSFFILKSMNANESLYDLYYQPTVLHSLDEAKKLFSSEETKASLKKCNVIILMQD
ncbi:MAG TPA: hypothetical protein PKK94_21675, partial [Leptospiraceae bacterium]|nr:hypothetical protein [Leptospiraceae bacterium]